MITKDKVFHFVQSKLVIIAPTDFVQLLNRCAAVSSKA